MSIRDLPRWAAGFLRVALPDDWRDDIVRDLEEAWSRRRLERGRLIAGAWLIAQSVGFAARFLPARLADLLREGVLGGGDLRLALRAAYRAPFVTVLTLISVSVGIFAATTGYTWTVGSLFVDLPFEGGDRLVLVEDYNVTGRHSVNVRPDEFLRRREALTGFEYLSAFQQRNVVVGRDGDGGQVRRALFGSWDFLHMTGVQPVVGRLPGPDDVAAGAPPVIVLPHADWIGLTGGDPAIVGTEIEVGGIRRTVIGVMPEGFGFPWSDDLWIPFDPRDADGPVRAVGRIAAGSDLATARAEMAIVARPDPSQVASGDVVEHIVTGIARPMVNESEVFIVAIPIALLVLLLVVMATNVANLMLARNARRAAELAVRGALGAGRTRIVGQLAAEVLLIVAASAVLGLAGSQYAIDLFVARVQPPMFTDYSLGAGVVLFTIGLALLVTLVAGILPALRATGRAPVAVLRDGRGGSDVRFGRLTGALIVVQVTICVGFLSAATLLGQSLMTFTFDRYGLPAEETLIAQVYFGFPNELNDPQSGLDELERAERRAAFMREATRQRVAIAEAVAGLPGVRATAWASRFPGNESERAWIEIEDTDAPVEPVEIAQVDTGYFELVGAGPTAGRVFTAAEIAEDADVAIVNEPFVRDRLRGANPLGRRIRLLEADPSDDATPWVTIVGVVPDLGLNPGNPENAVAVYRPLGDTNVMRLGVRGDGPPGDWTPALVEIARRTDDGIDVQWSRTLAAQMNQPVAIFRGMGLAFLLLGSLALLLSAASIHALTAATVTRRTRELGIRQALGAGRLLVARTVLTRAALQLSLGTVLGGMLTALLLQLASGLPWEVRQGNPTALAVVVGLLAISGLAALGQPLRRAVAIRPADAMRAE